jgi:outer membrane protein assembly complex protein YaeT
MMLVRSLSAYAPALLLVLAAAQPGALPAQDRKYEGANVAEIQFEPADQPLEADEIREILPLKTGQPLRIADVRAAIERLFATGRYADIQVDARPSANGVAIVFVTKNSWFVGDVSAAGKISSPPGPGQLENAARLDLGAPFSDALVQEAVTSQRRLLESNGLYAAEIRPSLDFLSDRGFQQVNVRFDVRSGPRASFGVPVLTGDFKMDPAKIFTAMKFRRWLFHSWKPVTQTRLRQGLDGVSALYQKEDRLEAKVSLDSIRYDAASNSAIPTIRIDAGPRIVVNPVGAKISQRQLRRYVPVFEEHAVDHDLLVEGARNLRDYFESRGYFDAQVQFKEQRVVNDQASIDFLIVTGARRKLAYIGIGGNKYFDTPSIRERMLLETASFLLFPHGRYSEDLVGRDEDAIASLYHANGFREAKVTHRLVENYGGKPGEIAVFLDIVEGPQTFIASLQVDGVERLDKAAILSRLSSVAGQPFSDFSVAVDRDAILAEYFAKGFPNATFEWSAKPAAEQGRVDVLYTIREGQEQVVRQVVATGYKVTRPSLIDSDLTLKPGDPLSPTAVTDIQRRLYDLGVFSKVDAAIQDPDGETTSKYVLYNVDEARRYSLDLGLGAGLGRIGGCSDCLEAPVGTTGFSPRVSVDVARNNLWGVGHSLSLRTRASTLDDRVLLNYSWPRVGLNPKLHISFTGLYEDSRDVRTADFKRAEGSAQLSERLSKATTLFYRLTYRRVRVSNLKVTEFAISQLLQPVRVGMPSLNLVQDRRDDPVEPHKGVYTTLDLGLASHVFGSQPNFMRFLARNASYYSLGGRLVLARSTEFGVIRPYDFQGSVLDAIPLPERFFGGGNTSQRGFPENEAGPRDLGTGFPLGGTALLFNQTELRFPIIGDNIGGALFHDFGNIFPDLNSMSFRTDQRNVQDFDYMVHAVGLGLRYRTPVGPLRLDFAYSINPPYFYGFKGSLQDLLNAGVNPCNPNVPNQCQVQSVGHFQFFFSIGQTF